MSDDIEQDDLITGLPEGETPQERYRDLEIEEKIADEKAAQELATREAEEQAAKKEEEATYIAGVRGVKRERTKNQVEQDLKKIKKTVRSKQRTKDVKEAMKYSKKMRQESIIDAMKHQKKPLQKLVQKVIDKVLNYKKHIELAPGEQAGERRKNKDNMGGIQLDSDFGSQVVEEKFTTKVNGVTVTGTISRRMDDLDGDGRMENSEQIGATQVTIDNSHDVATSSLGNITSDAVLGALNVRNNGGMER